MPEQNLTIYLRWVKSYQHETKEKVEIGLKWILSYLGAMLPSDTMHEAIAWQDNNIIKLDLSKAGYTEASQSSWNRILDNFKQTKEYQLLGSWDIGRFVLMTFNESQNYYEITGVQKKYENFKNKYQFDSENQEYFKSGESGVARGLRKVHFASGNTVDKIAHIAQEGHGETLQEFEAEEFEVFDFMYNGQPRFAVYGTDGNLRPGGDPALSFAGRPAKCMWCHESGVQLPFKLINDNPDKPELMSDFRNLVSNQNAILTDYYQDLTSEIDSFRFDKQSHYLAELLYITYQTPPRRRARNELKAVGKALRTFKPQVVDSVHREFKFLRNLVSRKELDQYLPYQSFLDFDARETS